MTLPAGQYFGKLVKWGTGESKEKKTPYVFLEFDVTHRDEAGAWEDISAYTNVIPAKRTIPLYLSDAAWPYTKEKLERLGFNGDFGEGMSFISQATTEGTTLWCTHEEYDGKTREKWDLAGQGGGYEHVPPSKDTLRRFQAKWKSEIGPKPAGRPAAPKASTRQPQPAAAGTGTGRSPSGLSSIIQPGDDEIPI